MRPEVTTVVDVHETNGTPILLSLPQMMNLGFRMGPRPDTIYVSCPFLGYNNAKMSFNQSRRL
eukprot:2051345-Prorocentrum_lima.AAC.1